ncbi:BNR-4 repeat-containing protein [Rathayibacter sp. Leaf299]|uniref:BNR-4 repeat-containing protein n=1 Tax=Rathayibacter sp. Leaf299 TaxID=1736328 RepID=UPI00138F762A|nr:BNR-4 repeat-containing protein [Rathayibacter sp. Leaf299]
MSIAAGAATLLAPLAAAAAGDPLTITDTAAAPAAAPTPVVLGSAYPVNPTAGGAARALAVTGMIQPILQDAATGATYVGYYNGAGRLTVAKRTSAGAWTSALPNDGNGPVVVSAGSSDVHNGIAISLDSAGNLHVAAAMHNSDMRYWRTTSPGDLSSLTFRTALPAAAGKYKYLVALGNEALVTYPVFFRDQPGTLYLMFRNGQSGAANTYLYRYDVTTSAWTNTVPTGAPLLGAGGTSGFTEGPDNYSAYPTTPVFHNDQYGGAYHLAWVWRGTAASAESTSAVHYAWTKDFTTWYPMNTSPSTPTNAVIASMTYSTTATLVDSTPHGGLLNENVQVGFDASQRVLLTYYKENSLGETKLYTARPTGPVNTTSTAWRISDITAVPNAAQNVTGDPLTSGSTVYASSWNGTANINGATPIYNSAPITVNPNGTMTCRYSYRTPSGNYQARRIIFTNTGTSGVSFRSSDTIDPDVTTPPAITARDSATASYDISTRTTNSHDFTIPTSGAWPAGSAGTLAHWVLRWESGPYSANNTWGTNYPATGTELRMYLITAA